MPVVRIGGKTWMRTASGFTFEIDPATGRPVGDSDTVTVLQGVDATTGAVSTVQTSRATGKIVGDQWYGPPCATWTAPRAMEAVRAGKESPAILAKLEKYGGGNAIASLVQELGPDILATIPGVSEVMGVLNIAKDIPIIGDILRDMGGQIAGIGEDILGGIDDVVGGVMSVVGEIPVVGDIAGEIYDVGGDIVSGIGDFFGGFF